MPTPLSVDPLSFSKYTIFKQLGAGGQTMMAILAAIVGLAGGFCAIGVYYLIHFFQTISYGGGGDLVDLVGMVPGYVRIGIPVLGGLCVGTISHFLAGEIRGHGVPEVMEAVTLKSGLIRKRVLALKPVASSICIGTGGSAGVAGPIIHIGSALGSTTGQIFGISTDRIRLLVGCGAAAGIAATFNAPIAGTMFAITLILGDFGLATFSPLVIFDKIFKFHSL